MEMRANTPLATTCAAFADCFECCYCVGPASPYPQCGTYQGVEYNVNKQGRSAYEAKSIFPAPAKRHAHDLTRHE